MDHGARELVRRPRPHTAKPATILMVSAHWEEARLDLSSTTGAPLTHDFWGFAQRHFDVTYDAPAAPELADDVAALVSAAGTTVHRDEARGLDHGAYVPLVQMFPEADVPVIQLSMPALDPRTLFAIGQKLAPLRRLLVRPVQTVLAARVTLDQPKNHPWGTPGGDSLAGQGDAPRE